MRNKSISSTEIARLVGVSRSTVSKVINNYPDIPDKTKEDIKKVIHKYNYHPNAAAQVLAGKKTKTIGLFMSAMNSDIGDYLFNFIVVRVVENFSMRGYHVIINTINDIKDPVCRELIKEVFYQGWVDAGIFLEFESSEPLIEELIADGYIVAAVDKSTAEKNELNRLIFNFDNYTPAKQAVNYLARLNHSKIAVINGEVLLNSGSEKCKGYLDGFAENSIVMEESWFRFGKFSIAGGYENMKRILESPAGIPTAVCCANDSIAFGALKAINEAGLRVPEDILLIRYNK